MPPGLLSRNEPGSSGGMSIGWLLAIALGGGALLFVTLAFILVSFSDRRAHRARLQAQSEAALVSNEEETTSTSDLNGHHQDASNHYRDPSRSPPVSPVREKRKSLPHILPQIKRNSSILSLFGSGTEAAKSGQGKVQHSRRKTSWIDEDAIHGPDIKRRESRRISLRESWLMMRTPTLPALLGYRDDPETEPFYRHQNYPLITAPRPATLAPEPHTQERNRPSRLPLVRSPSYELAQQRAAAMRYSAEEQQQQRQNQEMQEAYIQQQLLQQRKQQDPRQHQRSQSHIVSSDTHLVPNGPRPPPAAKLARIRTVNTDSNLALILRNTAERLRDGSPVPKRKPTGKNVNRNAQSLVQAQMMADAQSSQHKGHRRTPASLESPIKGFRNDRSSGPVMIGDLRGLQKTPSPKKMPVQAMTTPQSAPASVYERQQNQQASPSRTSTGRFATNGTAHQRNMSTSSMLSQDSLFGDSVPDHGETAPAGLSSPSRRDGQTQPSAQQHQRGRSTSAPSVRSSVSSALSTVYSEEEAEHERSRYRRPKQTQEAPLPRGRGPRQHGHVPKMSDPFLTVDPLAPKLPEKSPRRISVLPPLEFQLPYPGQDASVLGQISGNAGQNASPVMSSPILGKEHEHIRLSILMNESPQFSVQPIVRPRSVAPVKPVFKTSNSISSMRADPSTPEDDKRSRRPKTIHGQKPSIVPPPLDLCPIDASVRPGDSSSQWPPFNLNVHPGDSTHPLRQSPTGIRPLPDPELMSPTWAHLKRGGYLDDAPSRANSNASRRSSVYSETQRGDQSRHPARSPGSTSKRTSPVRMSPLTASIIQLRRMNSQMSAYSAASSMVSDTAAPDSPTLPTLRGGGFSPDRSNSRAVKAGRQNYLSMGTPSPRSKRSTRTASIVIDTKTAPGDEKENGRSHEDKSAGGGLGLKGSFRSSESQRRRMSVRFGEIKEHSPADVQAATAVAPAAEKQQQQRSAPEPDRTSGDSLYDKDGFLMSSPDRLPSSAAEGAGARPRSGLRM
ncbi:hypothetical protein F5X68DRAFT_252273 [Plectosphaerella plurivora]|uniref:Uncharacterized protein n=1 Tax=Plectosphaerella plurivora TaxID=936078 RepID=A0A9P8VHE8_9PEZI|nr:hypothetical protein F5X68DRAFT_252273 [Plectosphaerella plurivora]